jgi:hypothetical protein
VILLGQHLRLLRDELLGAQPEPKETLCTYSKLLKDTLRQLVSAMLSASSLDTLLTMKVKFHFF